MILGALDSAVVFDGLMTLAARSTLLLAAGWLGATLLSRAAPPARLALWASVVAGVLLMPVLVGVLPSWGVLPDWSAPTPSGAVVALERPAVSLDSAAAPLARSTPEPLGRERVDWRQVALLAWAAGASLTGAVFMLGWVRLRRITRSALPDVERQAAVRRFAREAGLSREVRVVSSREVASPATWGLWRPVIALPATAAGWGRERLRLVMAHELAHVARHDFAWRLAAQLLCVVYWFHPLVWLAARRLRLEQEIACDLAVVAGGARPSTYAHHLLSIARAASGRPLSGVALDMARRSQMEGRLMSILSNRSSKAPRRLLLLPAFVVLLALPLLAAAGPQAEGEAEISPIQAPVALAGAFLAAEDVPAVAPSPPAAPAPVSSPRPEVAAAPRARPALAPAPVVAPEPVVSPSATPAPAPSVAPSPRTAVSPAVAPTAPVASTAPVAPSSPAAPVDAETRRLEEEMARKAEEIAALMEPLHEEIERAMEARIQPILEQMELVHVDLEPIQEEMSRIGLELSEAVERDLDLEIETEELERVAQELAHRAQEQARLGLELAEAEAGERENVERALQEARESMAPLHEEMEAMKARIVERHRAHAEVVRERSEEYRERMEMLRERVRPDRERLERLREELEPIRRELEATREAHMSEVRERLETLRHELEELREERAARHRIE